MTEYYIMYMYAYIYMYINMYMNMYMYCICTTKYKHMYNCMYHRINVNVLYMYMHVYCIPSSPRMTVIIIHVPHHMQTSHTTSYPLSLPWSERHCGRP